MSDTITVVGSSWASGWRQEPGSTLFKNNEHDSWPALLSTMLGFGLISDVQPGSSNDRIYRALFDRLVCAESQLYIAELAPYNWYEVASSVTGKIEQIQMLYNTTALNKLILKEYYNPWFFYSNLLRKIISLQTLATQKNVDLYFLDIPGNLKQNLSLDDFCNNILDRSSMLYHAMHDELILECYQVIKDLSSAVDFTKFIFNESLIEMLEKLNTEDCTYIQGHPTAQGQQLIADLIYNKLKHKY